MALIKCKECGGQVSTAAKACPSCGAPPPPQTRTSTYVIGIIMSAIIGSCIISQNTDRPTSSTDETPEQAAARAARDRRHVVTGGCMEYVKRKLHDPSSAQFGHSDEATVEYHGDRALVFRQVRAKNALGAMRLTEFVCVLEMRDGKVYPIIVSERGGPQGDALARQFLTSGK